MPTGIHASSEFHVIQKKLSRATWVRFGASCSR